MHACLNIVCTPSSCMFIEQALRDPFLHLSVTPGKNGEDIPIQPNYLDIYDIRCVEAPFQRSSRRCVRRKAEITFRRNHVLKIAGDFCTQKMQIFERPKLFTALFTHLGEINRFSRWQALWPLYDSKHRNRPSREYCTASVVNNGRYIDLISHRFPVCWLIWFMKGPGLTTISLMFQQVTFQHDLV